VLSGSAKENKSINDLLENIIVMSDFKYHLTSNPSGVIIDSYLDKKTGWQVNELLIQSGVIKKKDCIFLNGKFGKIKILKDFNGEKAEEGKPGQIVQIVGLEQSAELGDKFLVINDKKIREEIKDELSDFCDGKKVIATVSLKNKKRKNLMIFSSTQNSLQAIVDLAKRKSSKDFSFNVAFSSVGSLNSHSLNLAKITESFIIFFGFFPSKETMNLMKENNIRYFSSNVIYELGDKLDEIISGNKEKIRYEKILGEALITNVFYFSKTGKIAGCKVVSGIISRNNNFRIVRKGKELFTGRIESLQSNKLNIKESRMGSECGIVFKDFENFKEGDKIIAFNIVEEDAK
jgi:translation initiation factor IF-2